MSKCEYCAGKGYRREFHLACFNSGIVKEKNFMMPYACSCSNTRCVKCGGEGFKIVPESHDQLIGA